MKRRRYNSTYNRSRQNDIPLIALILPLVEKYLGKEKANNLRVIIIVIAVIAILANLVFMFIPR